MTPAEDMYERLASLNAQLLDQLSTEFTKNAQAVQDLQRAIALAYLEGARDMINQVHGMVKSVNRKDL